MNNQTRYAAINVKKGSAYAQYNGRICEVKETIEIRNKLIYCLLIDGVKADFAENELVLN